ncbi:MAG TPA: hypothetical protein VG223_00755 [Solirubrobacteraceae bacterium]|nr:hypothetical protein [Solirubrobacteraceae bacterium]
MTRRAQLVCVGCGPVMLVSLVVGLVVLAGFIPGPHPAASAARIKAQYVHNLSGIRAGLCLFMAGIALIAPWGAAVAAQTDRAGLRTSVFTYVQVVCIAAALMIGVLSCIAWGVAAFRPGDISAATTRSFNDLGWILFIFDWSPLAVWYLAVGLSIFMDPNDRPVFPRWAGWLSVWTAVLSVPGGLTVFFQTGPLAFNGLLALWVPLGVFFVWIVAMTVLTIGAVNRQAGPSGRSAPSAEQLPRAVSHA